MNFGTDHLLKPVSITSSGSGIAGENNYLLTCSATIVDPVPLPPNIPTPAFEWFFGPYGNASLPSGASPMATVQSGNTFNSTLQFSLLSQSHSGMYTCRLGVGILANNATITVQGIINFLNVDHNKLIMSPYYNISSTWKHFRPD